MAKRHRRRKFRTNHTNALPKGAYLLPNGNYVTTTIGSADARGRRLRIRAVNRAEPDAKLVARALIELVIEQKRDAQSRPRGR